MNKELINIFENANKKFLSENKKFILSDVSERSLCGTLSQYFCSEIKKSRYSEYYVDVRSEERRVGKEC